MSETTYQLPRRVKPTRAQEEAMIEARVSFMRYCPFFAHLYYNQLVEWYTDEVPTLATDARRVFVNLDYAMGLKPMERATALAHEVWHVFLRDPQRMAHYRKLGEVEGLPYDNDTMNSAMDYRINADLIDSKVGSFNPAWLYDPDIKAMESVEDVYRKIYQPGGMCPPPPGGNNPPTTGSGGGETGNPSPSDGEGQDEGKAPKTYGKGSRPDKHAEKNQGRFDSVMEPRVDPVSGAEDVPSEMEFKENIARAAAAAKAVGNMPGNLQRMVDEILNPQIRWRDHLRLTVTGKIGRRRDDWASPNRRRIVLNPMIYLPGKKGHGCDTVVEVIDNSGSISERELSVFFSESGAIIADCKPRRVIVIWCDAAVRRVEEARTLDELAHIRVEGSKGGGGTDFRPPFEYLAENNIRPDTLIYFTDMLGPFPQDPGFPVIWCSTSPGVTGPFGETVHVKV